MSLQTQKPLVDERAQGLAQLDLRSRDIFRRLVETYLDTGEPVGSRTISRILPSTLSPASVRNVMMDLEESGLIYSPHTSAGRVPTNAGLRFFVDALLEVGSISPEERSRIDSQMTGANRSRRVEEVLGEATTLLSGLSHCAGLLVAPKTNSRLKHIEFVSLAPGRGLVILVAEDGTVENRAIDLPLGLPPSALIKASNYLSARMQGKTIAEGQRLMQEEIATLRTELDELTAKVIADGIATWSGNVDEEGRTLIVKGQGNLIDNLTALDDLERVRQLFDDLENKKGLIQLLGHAETGEGVRIFIGAENKLFSMSGSSLIVAPYRNREEKIVGALGIIGPTRMNYARIIPMVDYTARIIGRLIG
jgi:heat-inducible transcriptional repressor